jgi:hypothetical protein
MKMMKLSVVKRVLLSSLLLSGGVGLSLAQQQEGTTEPYGSDNAVYDPCYIHIGCTSDVQWLQDAAAGVYGDGWYCDDEVTPDCVDDECDSCQITPGCHAGPIWDSNNNVWVCSTEEEEGDDPDYTPAPAPQEQLYPTQASPATADSSEDYAVNDRRQFI